MKLRKSFFRKNIMVSSSELEKLRSENQNAYQKINTHIRKSKRIQENQTFTL